MGGCVENHETRQEFIDYMKGHERNSSELDASVNMPDRVTENFHTKQQILEKKALQNHLSSIQAPGPSYKRLQQKGIATKFNNSPQAVKDQYYHIQRNLQQDQKNIINALQTKKVTQGYQQEFYTEPEIGGEDLRSDGHGHGKGARVGQELVDTMSQSGSQERVGVQFNHQMSPPQETYGLAEPMRQDVGHAGGLLLKRTGTAMSRHKDAGERLGRRRIQFDTNPKAATLGSRYKTPNPRRANIKTIGMLPNINQVQIGDNLGNPSDVDNPIFGRSENTDRSQIIKQDYKAYLKQQQQQRESSRMSRSQLYRKKSAQQRQQDQNTSGMVDNLNRSKFTPSENLVARKQRFKFSYFNQPHLNHEFIEHSSVSPMRDHYQTMDHNDHRAASLLDSGAKGYDRRPVSSYKKPMRLMEHPQTVNGYGDGGVYEDYATIGGGGGLNKNSSFAEMSVGSRMEKSSSQENLSTVDPRQIAAEIKKQEYGKVLRDQISKQKSRQKDSKDQESRVDVMRLQYQQSHYPFGKMGAGAALRNDSGEILAGRAGYFNDHDQISGGIKMNLSPGQSLSRTKIKISKSPHRDMDNSYQQIPTYKQQLDNSLGQMNTHSTHHHAHSNNSYDDNSIVKGRPSNLFNDLTMAEYQDEERKKDSYMDDLNRQVEDKRKRKQEEQKQKQIEDQRELIKIHRDLEEIHFKAEKDRKNSGRPNAHNTSGIVDNSGNKNNTLLGKKDYSYFLKNPSELELYAVTNPHIKNTKSDRSTSHPRSRSPQPDYLNPPTATQGYTSPSGDRDNLLYKLTNQTSSNLDDLEQARLEIIQQQESFKDSMRLISKDAHQTNYTMKKTLDELEKLKRDMENKRRAREAEELRFYTDKVKETRDLLQHQNKGVDLSRLRGTELGTVRTDLDTLSIGSLNDTKFDRFIQRDKAATKHGILKTDSDRIKIKDMKGLPSQIPMGDTGEKFMHTSEFVQVDDTPDGVKELDAILNKINNDSLFNS